jgi:hypothetical protein
MKRMLAMLILGTSIAMPVAAFAAEAGTDNHPDPSMLDQAPAVYMPVGSTDQGTVAGPGQHPSLTVDTSRENGNNR